MDIFLLKIGENSRNIITDSMLSKQTVKRLKRTTHKQRINQIIYGDLLLQYVMYKKQRKIKPLNITYNLNGKPLSPKGFFNISNCKEWVMCAYSNKGEIGVDIEQYKGLNLGLAEYYFTEKELNKLLTLSSSHQITFFIDAWTFKESYVKCKGIKIFDIKNNINSPLFLNYFTKKKTYIRGEIFYYIRGFIENYGWCLLSKEDFKRFRTKVIYKSELFKTLTEIQGVDNNEE